MKTLFDTTRLGQMTLKNRFIRAAIGEKTADGQVNDDILELYKELAQGGTGTLITGLTLVDEAEKSLKMLAFYNDSFHEGHKKLTDLVHEHGANIILQIVYTGSYVLDPFVLGEAKDMTFLAPSAVEHLTSKRLPQEITVEQIKSIQNSFAAAALRAKNAGYDGVELHAAHGFLLSQFMTPHYNRRTDAYGGSVANRARMTLETYDAVRHAVGNDFSIWLKINVNDGFADEVLFTDVLYLCGELSKRKIDALEISGSFSHLAADATSYFKNEAEKIADANEFKVILTGGNRDFSEMTAILNETKIEYFGLARALLENADLVNQFEREYPPRPARSRP